MKKFELTLVVRDEENMTVDKMESDNLVHLLARFQVVLVVILERLQEKVLEEKLHREFSNDDIPF